MNIETDQTIDPAKSVLSVQTGSGCLGSQANVFHITYSLAVSAGGLLNADALTAEPQLLPPDMIPTVYTEGRVQTWTGRLHWISGLVP